MQASNGLKRRFFKGVGNSGGGGRGVTGGQLETEQQATAGGLPGIDYLPGVEQVPL